MDTGTGRLPDDQQASALAAADHRPGPERQVGLAQAAGPDLFKQDIESVHGTDGNRLSGRIPLVEPAADTYHAATFV